MKPCFQNIRIECWQHTGARLGNATLCLCLQAGAEACNVLLCAIDELFAEGAPAKRRLTLMQSQRSKKCSAIRLTLSPESDDLRQMSLTRDNETAIFEFTRVGLSAFRDAVAIWQAGGQDFSIHPEENRPKRKKPELGSKDLASGEVWFWAPYMDP
jgi:hypothetical protein